MTGGEADRMPRAKSVVLDQPIFGEPVFAEGQQTLDPTSPLVPHPSDAAVYRQIKDLLNSDVVAIPPLLRGGPGDLYPLADALGTAHGAEIVAQIQTNRRIVFHMVGDIGASNANKYPNELHVADQLAQDAHSAAPDDVPSFAYILGDLVYDFGEAQYYYDQFYEPYRNYPRPIFAIPGNHEGFILPGTPVGGDPLTTFQRNFCAAEPTVTPEAGPLHRTAMGQPGVFFALDAPFVRILGLFSNGLEDPGVISSENGAWPNVRGTATSDVQLDFLNAQLARVKTENYAGAVVLAVHHPPFTYSPPPAASAAAPPRSFRAPIATGTGGVHGSSTGMLRDIDTVCRAQGVYPHAILSGHCHNYQRFTRRMSLGSTELQVPFVVAGGGGHNLNPLVLPKNGSPAAEPTFGSDVTYLDPLAQGPDAVSTGLVLEYYDDSAYGYLRVSADAQQLELAYHEVNVGSVAQSRIDVVTVDLTSHSLVSSSVSQRAPSRKVTGSGPSKAG
jgi:calcineurin-like phosphoesterase family protein